jgi:hypothetical protein
LPLSVEFISETVEDIGNPLTFYQLLSIQSIQRNKNTSKWDEKYKF